MTHPNHTQTATVGQPTTATVVSEVTTQMQRIEQARQRIQASSHAIISGALASSPTVQTDAHPPTDHSQQRLNDMGRAMDQVLQGMQNQALADITGVMQQHAALRQLQQNMVRTQQPLGSSAAQAPASHGNANDVIDVEAKAMTEP